MMMMLLLLMVQAAQVAPNRAGRLPR